MNIVGYIVKYLLLLALLCAPAWAAPAWAAPAWADSVPASVDSELEEIGQEISDTTMSPFCPGRTLSACPSPQARDLRMQVQAWLKSGSSPEEVRQRLITTYGQEVTGVPKTEGFGIMAWLGPVIFLLIFLLSIVYAMKRMQKRRLSTAAPVAHADNAMKTRIEDELKSRML